MGRRSRKRPAERVRVDAGGPGAPGGTGEADVGGARGATSTRGATSARRPASARRPGQSRVDRMLERADERPKPPWHPVPLVEISVLGGIVLIVVGLLESDTSRGRLAMLFGLALASLAGLDTAVREHFAGYRSHSTLLAGMPAVVTVAALALSGAPFAAVAGAGAVVFAAGFWLFRRAFRNRAGVSFKV